MKEKKLFVLETTNKGGDIWTWKVEDYEDGMRTALDLWSHLTSAEKENYTIELVEGYTLEDDDQELDLSDYNPIWSSSEMDQDSYIDLVNKLGF